MSIKNYDSDEPLLQDNPTRYTLFPLKFPDIYEAYKKQVSSFWTPEEIDLGVDRHHWERLKPEEQYFIKHILAFFAGSDGIVMDNLIQRFTAEIKYQEAQLAYGFQSMMEGIHSEVYSQLIEALISDPIERDHLFKAIETIPCIAKKAAWAIKWISSDSPFALRLLAFAVVEGIFFSGAFCAIYWIKQRGILPGLTTSNEFIARDEGQHTDFAVLLYNNHIRHKFSEDIVFDLFREAVTIEKEFICESLPCSLLGMNSDLMSQYIEFVADRLLVQLGYNKLYKSKNPFDFMERISIEGKDNFFEKRVSNYAKSGVGVKAADQCIDFASDF